MENGRIVGTKHHRHHPDCKPTKRIEATTTSLDRANRKDIRIGLKTPKAAYAEVHIIFVLTTSIIAHYLSAF